MSEVGGVGDVGREDVGVVGGEESSGFRLERRRGEAERCRMHRYLICPGLLLRKRDVNRGY